MQTSFKVNDTHFKHVDPFQKLQHDICYFFRFGRTSFDQLNPLEFASVHTFNV